MAPAEVGPERKAGRHLHLANLSSDWTEGKDEGVTTMTQQPKPHLTLAPTIRDTANPTKSTTL